MPFLRFCWCPLLFVGGGFSSTTQSEIDAKRKHQERTDLLFLKVPGWAAFFFPPSRVFFCLVSLQGFWLGFVGEIGINVFSPPCLELEWVFKLPRERTVLLFSLTLWCSVGKLNQGIHYWPKSHGTPPIMFSPSPGIVYPGSRQSSDRPRRLKTSLSAPGREAPHLCELLFHTWSIILDSFLFLTAQG